MLYSLKLLVVTFHHHINQLAFYPSPLLFSFSFILFLSSTLSLSLSFSLSVPSLPYKSELLIETLINIRGVFIIYYSRSLYRREVETVICVTHRIRSDTEFSYTQTISGCFVLMKPRHIHSTLARCTSYVHPCTVHINIVSVNQLVDY